MMQVSESRAGPKVSVERVTDSGDQLDATTMAALVSDRAMQRERER
jgi:hypothetical protein